MLRHPKPGSLRWADVESLLVRYGSEIRVRKGSAIVVSLGGQKAYFHRPHPDDKADRGAIENALELLRRAGYVR